MKKTKRMKGRKREREKRNIIAAFDEQAALEFCLKLIESDFFRSHKSLLRFDLIPVFRDFFFSMYVVCFEPGTAKAFAIKRKMHVLRIRER